MHKFSVFLCVLWAVFLAVPATAEPHWSYSNQAEWGTLSKNFAMCKTGKKQSPIDITVSGKPGFSPVKLDYQQMKVAVFTNGHTIQANVPEGSRLVIGDTTYNLAQFHLHAPSEHRIAGKSYPAELHLVHKDTNGKLAVVGVMLQEGADNSAIQRMIDYTPLQEGEENSRNVSIDISHLISASQHYFSYTGSLTTPPCSENVRWLVMAEPITVSKAQIQALSQHIGHNARAIQPVNGRIIKESK